jgi:hypothetical protein
MIALHTVDIPTLRVVTDAVDKRRRVLEVTRREQVTGNEKNSIFVAPRDDAPRTVAMMWERV